MKIQILGTGCPKCRLLEANVRQVVEGDDRGIEVVKVEDIQEIMSFGVMTTPALAVDGVVKSKGKVLSPAEISGLLQKA